MKKLGVLGVGKMGSSILKGIQSSKILSSNDITIYTPNEEHQRIYKELGYIIAENEVEIFKNSEIILLAIKPQAFISALEGAKNLDFSNQGIISIAAGKGIVGLKEYFKNATIIRAMPNTPAFIQKATTSLCCTKKDKYYDFAVKMFSSIGSVVNLEESQMDTALPLNGSMPAYLYLFAKSFIEEGVSQGLSYEDAKKLCCDSIIGSTEMIINSIDDIDTLIQNVCSKGGTTLAGLDELYKGQFETTIQNCYKACVNRAKELNKV